MKYNASLDGYRTLAVFSVMLLHTAHRLDLPTENGRWLYTIMRGGWLGVDAFFVLSGFLITNILLQHRDQDVVSYFRVFYLRRILRIFPLYYLVISVILILLSIFSANKPGVVDWITRFTYFQNISPFFYPLQHNMFLGHTWSLAVEEQYYLIWPFLVYFIKPKRTKRLLVAGIFCTLLFRALMVVCCDFGPIIHHFSIARVDSLFAGSLLAMSELSHKQRSIWQSIGIVSAAVFIFVGMLDGNFYDNTKFNLTIGYTLAAISFSAFIIRISDPSSLSAKILKSKPLPQLGKFSYGIYLYHLPVFTLVAQVLNPLTMTFQYSARFFILFFSAASITLVISRFSYQYFEKPILEMKKRFEYA